MTHTEINERFVSIQAEEGYKLIKKSEYEKGITETTTAVSTALVLQEQAKDWVEVKATNIEEAIEQSKLQKAYESDVESRIRERYTVSQELAILRQRDSKPEEYAEYNAYAEECKSESKVAILKL